MGDMERGKSCDLGKRAQDVRRFLLAWLAVRAKRDFFSREIRGRPDLSVKAAGAALYRNEKWASIKIIFPVH